MRNLPCQVFHTNSAWVELAMAAADLSTWAQELCFTGQLRRVEPKRLRCRVPHVDGRLVSTGRRLILHPDMNWPWAKAWPGPSCGSAPHPGPPDQPAPPAQPERPRNSTRPARHPGLPRARPHTRPPATHPGVRNRPRRDRQEISRLTPDDGNNHRDPQGEDQKAQWTPPFHAWPSAPAVGPWGRLARFAWRVQRRLHLTVGRCSLEALFRNSAVPLSAILRIAGVSRWRTIDSGHEILPWRPGDGYFKTIKDVSSRSRPRGCRSRAGRSGARRTGLQEKNPGSGSHRTALPSGQLM